MPHLPRLRAPALLALILPLAASVPVLAKKPASGLSALEDIQQEFEAVPCEDKQRLAAVRALFEKAGAPAADISLDDHGHVQNLVVVKPGGSAERRSSARITTRPRTAAGRSTTGPGRSR